MFVFLLAVCALYSLTPVHNGNFFWHLRNGEDILDTSAIRTEDPFTWTRCGETWLQQEWGSEVLFALSWRIGGSGGPVVFKALVVSLAVLLAGLAAMRRGAGIPAMVLTAVLWFALSHGRWIVRPHVLSILMFSLYLYLLERGTGGTLRSLAVFIPLQVLWTNLHAGFIMGWFLLGIPVLEALFLRRWKRAVSAFAVLGAAILSAGVHPNGFGSFTYITDFLSRPLFRETIREWWSPFHHLYQPGQRLSTTAILLTGLLAATWILIALRKRKLGAARSLALAALSAASILSSRNMDFLALAAVAWVSPLLGRIRPVVPAVLLSAAAAVPLLLGVPREFGPPRPVGAGVDWSIYPRELADFLESQPELLKAKVFNTNEISGYLQYRLGSELPLYMDGRCHLYPERLYAEYLFLAYARPTDASRVMDIMDRRGIELALYDWPRPDESSAYTLAAGPEWLPVYWDSITVVYGRRSFLERTGFVTRAFSVVDPLDQQPLLQVPYYLLPDRWLDELQRAASSPMDYQPAILPAAALLLSRGEILEPLPFRFRSDSMRTALQQALSGRDPILEEPSLRVIQTWALAGDGRYDEAMETAAMSGDRLLMNSVAVLLDRGISAFPDEPWDHPPMMVPPGAWGGYLRGERSRGDSCVVRAAALFTCGMRGEAIDSVEAIVRRGTELHPWGYSVSATMAALTGRDSLALALGDSAVSLNTNPYTLLVMGKVMGLSGDTAGAIRQFTRALEISDLFHEARLQRADHLWSAGEVEGAVEDYRLLEELNYLSPAAESRLRWGRALLSSEQAAGR